MLLIAILQSLLALLSSKTLESDFKLTITDDKVQPITYAGKMQCKGDMFMAEAMGISAAYDGKTMYMYNEDDNELTLTNPTPKELMETNPVAYARVLINQCNATQRLNQDSTVTTVTLTPKDKSIQISKAIVKVKTQSKLPVSIEVYEGKRTYTLKFINPNYTNITPKFRLEKKGAFINDLR